MSIIALIFRIGLSYLPFANDIGLTPLTMLNLGVMLLIVATYIIS